jgi:hypothetical protein
MQGIKDKVKIPLVCRYQEKTYPLIAISERGAWVADGFAIYEVVEDHKPFRRWYLNPFYLFAQIFQTDTLPKGDPSTFCGRRIYYSHIDGDGWNSKTEIASYRDKKLFASEVILKEIVEKNPDLPIAIAPIGADLDPEWIGTEHSKEVANAYFSLKQVEMASHTYSHPFFWQFFENYNKEKEALCLYKYPYGGFEKLNLVQKLLERYRGDCDVEKDNQKDEFRDWSAEELKFLRSGYNIPRAFANQPFNLEKETIGSVELLKGFSPQDKKVTLYQWSGNCCPFPKALDEVADLGLANLNGGDTRFDQEFCSFAWVRSIGRNIEGRQQIYASCSNENTYTNLWKERFYAFEMLPQTWSNTETPLRLKPMNLYYHMYSGEKAASLNALLKNLDALRKEEFISVFASEYSQMAQGFFQMEISLEKEGIWSIEKRGDLQTIRFDFASDKSIDFQKSKGVLGFIHLHGSLYVSLDPAEKEVKIALSEKSGEKGDDTPYLIDSSWKIWDLKRTETGFSFSTEGWGVGKMRWKVKPGKYHVAKEEVVAQDGVLELTLQQMGHVMVENYN